MQQTNPTCPNCGEEANVYNTKQGLYYIRCDCGTCTPSLVSKSEVFKFWADLFKKLKPETLQPALVIKRGDVYWCEVPPRITKEGKICCVHYGRKPYVALSNARICMNSEAPLMVPISTSETKRANEYHQPVQTRDKVSLTLGEQITPVPREYILRYMCTLSNEDLLKVEMSVMNAAGIKYMPSNNKYKEAWSELNELIEKYGLTKDKEDEDNE